MVTNIKKQIKYLLRFVKSFLTGVYFQIGLQDVQTNPILFTWETSISLPILPSPLKEGKLQNLRIAIDKINKRSLKPGKIFSFWHEIGNPTANQGYTDGRVIRNGKISSEVAGGLCQLSGIIYYLSLEIGLRILERYPHTRDLYTDETRFTPLGTDASVVYPTKDLRIQNSFPFPLFFSFELTEDSLTFQIKSPEPIQRFPLQFQQIQKNGYSNVLVFRKSEVNGEFKLCSSDDYQL